MKLKAFHNKFNNGAIHDRKNIMLFLRWSIVCAVLLLWWFSGSSAVGIALILVLSSTTLIRMQFTNSFVIVLIEELACLFVFPYWQGTLYALLMPALESGASGNPLIFLPILVILFYKGGNNSSFVLILITVFFLIGFIIRAWTAKEIIYLDAADRERKQRYEVEQLKNELLTMNQEVAALAELTERNRIAQQLHDNVGHELAGALIALQTYKKLNENKDDRACDMLENVLRRVADSSIKLREAVYQLRPEMKSGASRLQKLCDEFTFCPIHFSIIGNKDMVPVTVWIIFEPCLKESLTNIMKYSEATEVVVKIDINPYFVRMNIKDNGCGAKEITTGFGLMGIKERVRAAGGTVSIDGSYGFMITCILPMSIEISEEKQ